MSLEFNEICGTWLQKDIGCSNGVPVVRIMELSFKMDKTLKTTFQDESGIPISGTVPFSLTPCSSASTPILYNKPFFEIVSGAKTYPANTFHSISLLPIGGDAVIDTGEGAQTLLENEPITLSFDTLNADPIIIVSSVKVAVNAVQ